MKHIHCLSKDCLPRIVDIAEKKKQSRNSKRSQKSMPKKITLSYYQKIFRNHPM